MFHAKDKKRADLFTQICGEENPPETDLNNNRWKKNVMHKNYACINKIKYKSPTFDILIHLLLEMP